MAVDASAGMSAPFDLLNIIEKRNTKFQITTFATIGPLFASGGGGVMIDERYRINGDSEIFFLYGPSPISLEL